MILDFESFEQLKNHNYWPIYYSKENRGYEKYINSIKKNCIVIGICGNKNRGKSFILNKIMDIPGSTNYKMLPGPLNSTIGISVHFHEFEGNNNQNFITLDTASRDNPLLENTGDLKSDNNNNNNKENIRNKEIILKARAQKVCKAILSDFILEKSNVLIAVVEQLSYVEQTMLQNLTNQLKEIIKKNNKKKKDYYKKLIVIHNLYTLKSIEEINNFIEKTLKKSFTFKLEKTKGDVIKGKIDIYEEYIKEEENLNKEKINFEIIHLIFGDDNNKKIKEYFNKQTIDYIRNAIIVSNQVKFDLIESFKNFLINNSTFLEGSRFKKDDFEIKKEQENAGIYLTKKKDIKLKGV